MKKLGQIILGTAIILLTASCNETSTGISGDRITRSMVMELVDTVEEAAKLKDSQKVLSYYSDDVIFNFTISTSEGSQDMTLDKSQFEKMLVDGWKVSTTMSYRKENVVVDINSDETKAEVSYISYERSAVMGQEMSTRAEEKATLKLVNNTLLVTRFSATIEM